MNTLIVVDIQNDFVPGGSLAVPGGNEIIPLINRLQLSFSLVVATQDWHPAQHKSFASNHPGKKPFEKILLDGLEQILWPDHCVQGTMGAAFHPSFQMNSVEAIFRKGTDTEIDSYSAFYDNAHRKSTGLTGYLRERSVTKIFLCGLAADFCVFYSAKDALSENFETYIIEDATRAIDPDNFTRAKTDVVAAGGQVITSSLLQNHL